MPNNLGTSKVGFAAVNDISQIAHVPNQKSSNLKSVNPQLSNSNCEKNCGNDTLPIQQRPYLLPPSAFLLSSSNLSSNLTDNVDKPFDKPLTTDIGKRENSQSAKCGNTSDDAADDLTSKTISGDSKDISHSKDDKLNTETKIKEFATPADEIIFIRNQLLEYQKKKEKLK